jgi:hypothetical protein
MTAPHYLYTGFPDLDLASIRRGLDRPLALWYTARTADRAGSGRVSITAVAEDLPRATRWRVIRDGAGVFWVVGDGGLFLRGLGGVASVLQVPRLTVAYRAPVAWLSGRRQLLRSTLFLNAVSLLRNGRPIAVCTMSETAGVSRSTIQQWQRLTNWERLPNAALLERLRESGPTPSPQAHFNRRSRDGRVIVLQLRDGIWLAGRLPNSLVLRRPPEKKRAVLRRVNAELPSCENGDSGQRQLYARPGQHRLPSPQYQFHSQIRAGDQLIQLWIPYNSPKKMGAVFETE